MEKKKSLMLFGKIAAALSAVVLASCLIQKEQSKKNDGSNSQPAAKTNAKSAEVDKSFSEKPVTEMIVKVKDNLAEPVIISKISETGLQQLFYKIEISRMDSEFFSTSKSGPPPSVNYIYTLTVQKGKNSENINIKNLSKEEWQKYQAKIVAFHEEKLEKIDSKEIEKKEVFIHSSKAMTPELEPDVIISPKVFIHSSKAPAFSPEYLEELKKQQKNKPKEK